MTEKQRWNTAVSLIALAPNARVRTKGLKYLLNDELLRSATHGLSNVAMASRLSVAATKGMILLCAEGGETWFRE